MYTLTVPITSARQLPKLVFPERCLKCGKPKAGTRKIAFDMNATFKKKIDHARNRAAALPGLPQAGK